MKHKLFFINRLKLALCLVGSTVIFVASGCFHPPEDELTKGIVAGEHPVAMEGTQAFFGGKVIAKVTLGRGIGKGLKRGKGDKDQSYKAYAENDDKTLVGSPLPPVTLHIILTNKATEAITVEIIDFISEMGNFAVDPDRLTIAPGQSAEPTPMVSQLGVSSDSIPFKVTLRLAKAKESQTVLVKILPNAEPAPEQKK